jgi:DNA primase large subunit
MNQKERNNRNNYEYENMPSVDFGDFRDRPALVTEKLNEVDWDIVRSVCERHGFDFAILRATFGKEMSGDKYGNRCDVVVFKKLDIDTKVLEGFQEMEEYGKINELRLQHGNLNTKLHDCIHELDEETNLFFNTYDNTNFGFTDGKVAYSLGTALYSWNDIIALYPPCIYDILEKIPQGAYLFISTDRLKF